MARYRRAGILAIGLAISLSASVWGETPLTGAGALRQYCATADGDEHPGFVEMVQVVNSDELATFGGTRFVVAYEATAEPEWTGRVVARFRIVRADGRIGRSRRMVARQQENGGAEREKFVPLALRAGDRVIWRLTFKNFAPLAEGECALVIGATVLPSGGP